MYINKPESPEELYPFFVKGIPLTPTKWFSRYRNNFRRKGWNIYTNFIKYREGNEAIRLEYYSAIRAYRPDWILGPFKYVDTETN